MAQKIPTLSILIPVYNENDTLDAILKEVLASPYPQEIVIVDDGSTDGTRDKLKKINNKKIQVFLHKNNQGKGAAVRTALSKAKGEYILIQDADLEYDPKEYKKLLEPVINHGAPIVYGSRFSGNYENMRAANKLANQFLSLLTSVLYGKWITDMETCYKLMKRDVVKNIPLHSRRFDVEPEITSKLLKRKIPIVEVPITYKGRNFEEGKKIGWRDGMVAIWTLFKYRFTD